MQMHTHTPPTHTPTHTLTFCLFADLQGWDKTYCLQFVNKDFDTIHFFGDKTFQVASLPEHPSATPICLALVSAFVLPGLSTPELQCST